VAVRAVDVRLVAVATVVIVALIEAPPVAIDPHAAAVVLLLPVAAVASPHATRTIAVTATTTDVTEIDPGAQIASATSKMTVSVKMTARSRTTVTAMKSARVCHYHFATSTLRI
jgi:hypothetical protein